MTDRGADDQGVPTEQDMHIDPSALNNDDRTPIEELRAILVDTAHDEEERLEEAEEGQ
ncbi:hypothetical protein [Deinococcus aerius]|nr:hypothetical protein [Deinococcus aerius]